jgi:predicted transcriptional regulator
MSSQFSSKQLDNFFQAASSLKLFSRAELNDERNRSLIEKLYVDPLPNEQVFKTLLGDNTTILVGRKGTGKSTIFQRVQHELRKNKSNAISAYMDIRNVYESSQVDPVAVERLEKIATAMTSSQVQKFLLYKRFFRTLISDIRNELKSQVEQSFLSRIRDRVSGTSAEVFAGFERILAKIDAPAYENIDGFVTVGTKKHAGSKLVNKASASAEFSAKPEKLELSAKGALELETQNEGNSDLEYARLLMRVVGVNEIIQEVRRILNAIGIKYLYVFLDDFSELPEEAMHILVDSLISPLTRWSDFIKFKIAAYPGRVYLGSLDKTKIEEFHLDIYGLYGSSGVTNMEEKATEFVRRVVERRVSFYCKGDPDLYFDLKSEDLWKIMYYASMANPRILGHIILYAHESHLLYGRKIGIRAIQEASQRYYEEKVAPFFSAGKYRSAFNERSSVYSLKELLETIVNKARSIRQEDRARDSRAARGRTYSSHFYVCQDFEDLLASLELNFFVTKYFEQSDRAGTRVSIYALNYGLCTKYQIGFGRPAERREDRLYFVERMFDYNSLLRAYMAENQEIKCDGCGAEFDVAMLPALKMLHMRCPSCRDGICHVVNLSRKYGDILESIRPELLLPDAEIGILQTLHSEKRNMVAAEIAGELDCSGQLVGRRAKNLAERSLVTREHTGSVYRYKITPQAEAAYFVDPHASDLNLD